MKRINYPARKSPELSSIINDYLSIFLPNLFDMEARWNQWKKKNAPCTIIESVRDLLVADVDLIADVFDRFRLLGISTLKFNEETGRDERNPILKELDEIFKYDSKYDTKIADFFIKYAGALNISSCYYCDMAYINTYSLSSPKYITPITSTLNKRHFDLDHFLPKSICPVLGLSLFNLVPSCQACNSRIKRNEVIGNTKDEWTRLNPAGEDYLFDDKVIIKLSMYHHIDSSFTDPNNYRIKFHCKDACFQREVDLFHLEERYEFHKSEAMRLKQMRAKYPRSTIKKIAVLMKKSESEITEDLFHQKFLSANDRCFAKLTRDMLK